MHMQINVYFYYICIIYLCTNTDTMGNNIKNYFYFLNYENMIIHLQETWKIQNKVTYSATIYD